MSAVTGLLMKGSAVLTYDLNQRGRTPKYEFLYRCLRDDISSGRLAPNQKLPSKRRFAKHLGVSVSTVETSYNMLHEGGYVWARQGSGFYVSTIAAERSVVAGGHDDGRPSHAASGAASSDAAAITGPSSRIDFSANRAGLELFPTETWSRIMRSVLADRDPELLDTVPYNGLYALRRAIADHLRDLRGISTSPDNIVIGAGTEYLYGRLLQLFGPRCVIALGDAGSTKLANIAQSSGVTWDFIPIDRGGMQTSHLIDSPANVVLVSPANQFPTGNVLLPERRLQLLDWAHSSSERYLIEDDYDSELRYEGGAPAPLFSQDDRQRTVYLNTFSKTLVPSLRISYMVLPDSLAKLYREQLSFYSCTVSSFEQLALARFISEGYFERHLHRLVVHYRTVRDALMSALHQSPLMKVAQARDVSVGTHLILHVSTTRTDGEVVATARSAGLHLRMLTDYCLSPDAFNEHCVVVNFASFALESIPAVAGALEKVFAAEIAEASQSTPRK
ncbi:MAG: PLP-dependent aminotransferase family protein [Coriobacteriales bacterium]|jgi:GntR family transcriptional regulator/MocR family aminotransferase